MKITYFLAGLVLIIVFSIILKREIELFKIEQEGVVVEMKITSLPNTCESRRYRSYAAFSYNGKKYSRKIPPGYCKEHSAGDHVRIKYLPGHRGILFEHESVKKNLLLWGLGIFVGLFTIWSGVYNYRHDKKDAMKEIR